MISHLLLTLKYHYNNKSVDFKGLYALRMPQYFKTDDFISKMVDRVRCSKDIGTCAGVLRILDARSG